MTDLKTAAQQALEALETGGWNMTTRAITDLRAALAQQAEPDISRCPKCNGPADNGFDRSIPPSPYFCTKCMAEPVEPVAFVNAAHLQGLTLGLYGYAEIYTDESAGRVPLYPAPPQRLPLTEEEIVDAVREADLDWQAGWTLDEHEPNRFTTLARAAIKAVEGELK